MVRLLVIALLALAPAPSALAALDSGPRAASGFAIANVERPVALRASPGGRILARVSPLTELGSPQALGVVKVRNGWLGVVSPRLPAGRLGWLPVGSAHLTSTTQSLTLDLSRRLLTLRADGKVVRRMPVGIGSSSTPTPVGRFAVTDKLSGAPYGPWYGCCIVALSARQDSLPVGWEGGDRIAIHGTDRPRTIGIPSSNGCVHARADDLRLLMRRLPLGAPVFIHA
ncbi:MAG TPA: L,D-transpeptidase [Gaiellaceae bacterium]|nr:L,D-transpeptidase [Gaiellaceae bacterium]